MSNVQRKETDYSLRTVSSPFRGTQLVYHVGEDASNAPDVRWFSLGYMLARCVYLLAYLAPILPAALDMHTESRSLSFYEIPVLSLLWSLWACEWAEAEDAAPFDVTFQASIHRETLREGATNPGTYYRSYVACIVGGPPSTRCHRWLSHRRFHTDSRPHERPTYRIMETHVADARLVFVVTSHDPAHIRVAVPRAARYHGDGGGLGLARSRPYERRPRLLGKRRSGPCVLTVAPVRL